MFGWSHKSERFWLLVILLTASLATHVMWLSMPRQVIFDEVHFGKFVTAYCCSHERFFDIHPPHGKLIVAGAAKLMGFQGGYSFANIGLPYGDVSPIPLRAAPALAGILLPAAFFFLLSQLRVNRAAAFFGGVVVLLDNALTLQTRIMVLDGFMLLAIVSSLIAWFEGEKRVGRVKWLWYLLAGMLAGLAVGVKFTGLVALALLIILLLVKLLRVRSWDKGKEWGIVLTVVMLGAVVIYGLGWVLHFGLLTEPGSGDAWRVPNWENGYAASFFRETVALHKIMLGANYGLAATHPDSSMWWEWPIMKKSVFYWVYGGGGGRVGAIYFLGNPVVWWGSTLLLLIAAVDIISRLVIPRSLRSRIFTSLPTNKEPKIKSDKFSVKGIKLLYWLPVLGFLGAYIPLLRVPRALFLYHYLTPLIFAIMIGVLWLDRKGFFRKGSVLKQSPFYYLFITIIAIGFLVFSPLTYGFLLPPHIHDQIFWLESWR